MKKYPRLVFLFTAIVVVMCRCHPSDDNRAIAYSDGTFVNCSGFMEYDDKSGASTGSGYECPLTCPDGSTVSFDIGLASTNGQKFPKDELQAKYCKAGAAAAPTATLTPVPTATETPLVPASIQPVAVPLLTGQVTTCDLESRFINFRLVQGAPVTTGSEVVLTMNQIPLKCTVPPSNKSVLSCLLPAGIEFPVTVSIAIGDSVANQFSYNGDECFYVEPTQTEAPTSQPAVTPTPT